MTYIIADETVPDGVLRAYAADGRLIVEIRLSPVYMATTLLSPPEPEIYSWRANPEAVARYAAMRAWSNYGHYVMGRA